MICYLKHKEIDFVKWDQCIDASFNGKPYALSWYLNLASPKWDALVLNDYEAVMPLTHRKKFGISYLYQPIMCQQLGVFSRIHTESFCTDPFIDAIPAKFKLIEVPLNTGNFITPNNEVCLSIRLNQYLPLKSSYQNIQVNFHASHKKNIAKAKKAGVTISVNSIRCNTFIEMKISSLKRQNIILNTNDISHYSNLIREFDQRNLLKIYTAYHNGIPISFGAFITIGNWATIQSFNTEIGKKYSAGYLIMDTFLQDFSESGISVDFMGSSVPGIAYNNKGYGSFEHKYAFIKKNRLPWFLKFLKK